MMHEAQMHSENSFITFTFDNEHLPSFPHSIDKEHMTLFFKKLRYKIGPFRYYYAGEYGEPTEENDFIARPHYHLCLFGWEPFDCVHKLTNPRGDPLYSSEFLDSVWGNGHTTTGELTIDSASYTARYVTKKITGKKALRHYNCVDKLTGECAQKKPEFALMSTKPGIGAPWLEKYHSDVYPSGTVVYNGQQFKPPKYYDRIQEKLNPIQFSKMKVERIKESEKHKPDQTWARLKARQKVKIAQIRSLPKRS